MEDETETFGVVISEEKIDTTIINFIFNTDPLDLYFIVGGWVDDWEWEEWEGFDQLDENDELISLTNSIWKGGEIDEYHTKRLENFLETTTKQQRQEIGLKFSESYKQLKIQKNSLNSILDRK
jgi:hypothetical protein